MLCTKCGVEGGNDLVNITSVLRAEQGQRSQKKETKLCTLILPILFQPYGK